MPLTLLGNPVLDAPSEPVSPTDLGVEFRRHCNHMLRAMYAAHGAGLAGPQIADPRRYFVYDCDGDRGVLVNPTLHEASRDRDTEDEGCLSVPGFRWPTRRAHTVQLTGLDALGHPIEIEASGYLARCFQHEIDHLDGRLYLSRLDSRIRRRARHLATSTDWHGADTVWLDVA